MTKKILPQQSPRLTNRVSDGWKVNINILKERAKISQRANELLGFYMQIKDMHAEQITIEDINLLDEIILKYQFDDK